MDRKKLRAAWVDFLVCFFFGIYGIHKFRQKKIGLGILYLFTGGLFLFGWLYDYTKLLVIAICTALLFKKSTDNNSIEEESAIIHSLHSRAKKIALIVVIGFILFFILIVACAPNVDTSDDNSALAETTNTIETTAESTSAPTTEPTTAPTTSPTTPTTEPTTVPTSAPTTAPTTAPTNAPTNPTTEPPHTHSFSAATCTAPKTCPCGATEGSANGHNWKDATYVSPKTCTTCGTTEGNPLDVPGKENYHSHVYTGGSSSKKYHYESQCAGKNSHEITWDEVERRGLGPCSTCVLK